MKVASYYEEILKQLQAGLTNDDIIEDIPYPGLTSINNIKRGDVVIYVGEDSVLHPALVTYVWSQTSMNLWVFPNGFKQIDPFFRSAVPFSEKREPETFHLK
jgi:hypothetical protein